MIFRVKGDAGPPQLETLRFVQRRADGAYKRGLVLIKAGRLPLRLSDREALGNYVGKEVRRDLRERYNHVGIGAAGKGPVRVSRRENNSSGADLTYRRPHARVADVAFEVTLTQKTLQTPQVRGFFDTDFGEQGVVIIRPSHFGPGATYVITRPETKR